MTVFSHRYFRRFRACCFFRSCWASQRSSSRSSTLPSRRNRARSQSMILLEKTEHLVDQNANLVTGRGNAFCGQADYGVDMLLRILENRPKDALLVGKCSASRPQSIGHCAKRLRSKLRQESHTNARMFPCRSAQWCQSIVVLVLSLCLRFHLRDRAHHALHFL